MFGIRFPTTSRRGWVVAEAGRMEWGLADTLIEQKRSVATIDGSVPQLAYGWVASFNSGRGGMRLDVFGPDENDVGATDVRVDIDVLILAYYRPFLAALKFLGPAVEAGPYQTAVNTALGLRVALLSEIAERVGDVRGDDSTGLFDAIVTVLRRRRTYQTGSADGTLIRSRWSPDIDLDDWLIR